MTQPLRPLDVVFYQDLFCAWCYLAEKRLTPLLEEWKGAIVFRTHPFPLRIQPALPTRAQRYARARELSRARRQPEGALLCPDLWTGSDVPDSSLLPLVSLEAARLQGREVQATLAQTLRVAALERGINIARSDVLLELACAAGLNMDRFLPAFQSPETRRLVLERQRFASERGVGGVPTLVLGGKWMVSGLRSSAEYQQHLLSCLAGRTPEDLGPVGPHLSH